MRHISKLSGQPLDEIRLKDLSVLCKIGIYPEESETCQAIKLNIKLYLSTREAAHSGHLIQSVDYSALSQEIKFILVEGRFRLLESAAEALASYILANSPRDRPRAACEAVEIEIIKPEALGGLSIPAVRIFREREESVLSDGSMAWQKIFAGSETSLFRGVIPAHTSLRPWLPGWVIKAIMTGGAGLKRAGLELASAEQLLGEDTVEQFLSNEGLEPRSFLAVAHRNPQQLNAKPSSATFGLIQANQLS